MGKAVLLRHDTPAGFGGLSGEAQEWHYDLLLEPDEPAQAPLIAVRVWVRLDLDDVAAFVGQRLPAHRRLYLAYEGDLSGNRGRVARLAEGSCRVLLDAPGALEFDLEMGHFPSRRVRGEPIDESRWRFDVRRIPVDPGG
ncbi:MAG: hypothetical protein KF859_04350 [Phycisphaeraceae bacterium]|nr:hypothetical protein [Phycisphaeraceae bacterium]